MKTRYYKTLQKRRFYLVISVLFVMGFTNVNTLSIAGSFLGFSHSSLHTALAMFLPFCFIFFLLVFSGAWQWSKHLNIVALSLLLYISALWLLNFFYEINSLTTPGSLSAFDKKRCWFFVHSVLLSGLIGIVVSREPLLFIHYFVPVCVSVLAVSSLIYVMSYDFSLQFVRLLGDVGLSAGIFASLGATSCLSLFILQKERLHYHSTLLAFTLISIILIHCIAIALSATRVGVVGFVLSLVVFIVFSKKKWWLIISICIGLGVIAAALSTDYLYEFFPPATISRLFMMKEFGVDVRYDLLVNIAQIIIKNPLGKVTGYWNSRLEMEYCHNTIVQFIAEAGLTVVPVLIAISGLVFWCAVANLSERHFQAGIVLGSNVLIQSFSYGPAYNAIFWFLVFFFASTQVKRSLRRRDTDDRYQRQSKVPMAQS